MSLRFDTLPIEVGQGLAQHVSARNTRPPYALQADDIRIDEDGAVGKRPGFVSLPTTGASGTPLGVAIHNDSVVQFTTDSTYDFNPEKSRWVETNTAPPPPCEVTTFPGILSDQAAVEPDMAVIDNVACVVWYEKSREQSYAAFYAVDTGELLQGPLSLGTNMKGLPRVCVANSTFFMAFAMDQDPDDTTLSPASIYMCRCDTASATYSFTTPVLAGSLPEYNAYDISWDPASTTGFLLAHETSDNLRLIALDSGTMAIGASVLALNYICGGVFYDPVNGRLLVVGVNTSRDVVALLYSTSCVLQASTTLCSNANLPDYLDSSQHLIRAAVAKTTTTGIYGAVVGTTEIWRSSASAAGTGARGGVYFAQFATSAGAVTPLFDQGYPGVNLASGMKYSAPLAGFLFFVNNTANRTVSSSLDLGDPERANYTPSLLLVVTSLKEQAHPQAYSGGSSKGGGPGPSLRDLRPVAYISNKTRENDVRYLPSIAEPTSGVLMFPHSIVIEDAAITGTDVSRVDITKLTLTEAAAPLTLNAQQATLVGTGFVGIYDGVRHVENAFHWSPFLMEIEHTWDFPANGNILDRWFSFVMVWWDSYGNKHRSRPTYARQVVVEKGGSDEALLEFRFFIPPTAINGDRNLWPQMEVYASETFTSGSTELTKDDPRYRIAVKDLIPSDHEGLWQVTVEESESSRGILTSQLSTPEYAQSQGDNEPTVAVAAMSSTKDLVFYVPHTRDRVYYSKQVVANLAVEFPPENEVLVPADGGLITALTAMDDKLIIFKKDRVYASFIQNGGYGTPKPIPSATGCTQARSVVLAPQGAFFMGNAGIHLIDRGTAVSFVGAPVQDYTRSNAAKAAGLVPGRTEVWFLLEDGQVSEGRVLVYNYQRQCWTRYLSMPEAAGTSNESAWYACSALPRVYEFSEDHWSMGGTLGDSGSGGEAILPIWESGWVALNGVEGFQRVRRVLLSGNHTSGGLTVTFRYDFDEAAVDTWSYTETELQDIGYIDLSLKPSRQKCKSISIRVEETSDKPNTSDDAGFTIDGLELEVGVKRTGYRRLNEAQRGNT